MRKGMKMVAVLAAALMFSGCTLFQNETPVASKTSTQKAYIGNLVLGLSADGSITLPVTGLDFAVSGIIKDIYVSPGDMVKKGDLLAELDDTDLQLALKTAQNNLDKALLAYDEAVATANYNEKSEQINLESTKRQLETGFDDYTYQLSIDNAALALERRKQDLEDTKKSTAAAEDAARLTLSRKEAELAEAKAELAKAEAEEIEDFDEFTYQNNIKTAKNNEARMTTALNAAGEELEALIKYYTETLDPNDPNTTIEQIKSRDDAIANAQKSYNSALNNYNDARDSTKLAKENLNRDSTSYTKTESERIQEAIDSARKVVESAQQIVDDARISLDNTITDNVLKLASAQQAIIDAETALANANMDLARGESSYQEQQRSAQYTYDLQMLKLDNVSNSDSAIKNALYNIEDAKNALESAENDLTKVRITAPIDGEVLNVTKKVGEKVSETESAPGIFMGTGSASSSFVTIRDLSNIYLTTKVPEGDIVGLSVGQQIRVAVDALGEENISATVYSISSIPNADSSGIITYEVVGVLDELNDDIRDSMSVFLTFIKREKLNVLLIPNKSVFIEDGQQYAYIQLENGELEKRAVTCGLSNGTLTEVIEGIESGETVIVGKVNV